MLYGDTADGPWYFQLLKDGKDIHEIRDTLLFGQSMVVTSATPARARLRR